MFELAKPNDCGEYARWANTFAEASARLDALETALTALRRFLRDSEDIHSSDILKVLDRYDV